MNVRRFERVEGFLDRAMPFLVAHEAENILLLGICGNIQQGADSSDRPLYFVTVEDGGQVVGAAIRTTPFMLVLAHMGAETLPALARIMAKRYGFTCTVLFGIDPKDGTILPGSSDIRGLEALDSAVLLVMMMRFINLPDD